MSGCSPEEWNHEVHHVAIEKTDDFTWKALCGEADATLFTVYPQYLERSGQGCPKCLDHPDYALMLLAGEFE